MSPEIFVCGGLGLKWQIYEQMQVVHICKVVSSIDRKTDVDVRCIILMAGQLLFDVWGFAWVYELN